MKRIIIFGMILVMLLLVGCVENTFVSKDTTNEINQNGQKVTIGYVTESYQKFHSSDLNNIDCNVQSFMNTDLINFSFSPFNSEYSSYAKPTKWYPSLKKGQISWFSGNVKNVGCTEIDLAYFSVIVFEDKIIYSSPILERDSNLDYDKYLPQQEKSVLFSPVASEYTADVFEITNEGNYTVFIFLKNLNTGNVIGVEKYIVDTSQWT